MRSDLTFKPMVHVSNRYQLTRLVSKATRALHRPGTRIPDAMNEVLARFSRANPIADRGHVAERAIALERCGELGARRRSAPGLNLDRKINDQPGSSSKLANLSFMCSSALPAETVLEARDSMLPGQRLGRMR